MDYERNFIYKKTNGGGGTMIRKLIARAWAEFQQRSFTFKILVPLLGALVLVFVGLLYYSISTPASTEEQPSTTVSTGEGCEKPGIRKGWCLYENAELGFSFEYPEEWGGVDFEIEPGDNGTAFYLVFETENHFPRSYLYTTDWSQAENAWDEFAYYSKNEDGTYNFHSLDGDIVLSFQVSKSIELFHGIDEVLILEDEEAEDLEKSLSRGEGGDFPK